MNNDHDTRTDNSSFVIGQALSGRHLLDTPLDASSYQGAGRFNGADDTHGYSNTPRPLSRPPLRRMDHRSMSERFAAPEHPQPQSQPAVIERRTVAAAPPVKHAPAVIENDNDDDDDINSNGLVSRSGCPRGWLITESELEKRFARLGASFEDVEVDTEADHRHATPIQPARPSQSASYTSLFDLPRRARSR